MKLSRFGLCSSSSSSASGKRASPLAAIRCIVLYLLTIFCFFSPNPVSAEPSIDDCFVIVPENAYQPRGSDEGFTFSCCTNDTTTVWNIGNQDYSTQKHLKFGITVQNESSSSPQGDDCSYSELHVTSNSSLVTVGADVVCKCEKPLSIKANLSFPVTAAFYDPPNAPTDLLPKPVSMQMIMLSWKPAPSPVATSFLINITNLNTSLVEQNVTNENYFFYDSESDICHLYEFVIVPFNDAGEGNSIRTTQSVPLSPDIDPVSESLVATLSTFHPPQADDTAHQEFTVSISFDSADICGTFHVDNYTITILEVGGAGRNATRVVVTPGEGGGGGRGGEGELTYEISSYEEDILQPDAEYSVSVSASSASGILISQPSSSTTFYTTHVQKSTITYGTEDIDNDISVHAIAVVCRMAPGSKALGCLVSLIENGMEEIVNVTRSSPDDLVAEGSCISIDLRFDVYEAVNVYTVNADGYTGTQPVPMIANNGSFDHCNFTGPTQDPITTGEPPSNFNTGAIVGIVIGVLLLLLLLATASIALLIYCFHLKSQPKAMGEEKMRLKDYESEAEEADCELGEDGLYHFKLDPNKVKHALTGMGKMSFRILNFERRGNTPELAKTSSVNMESQSQQWSSPAPSQSPNKVKENLVYAEVDRNKPPQQQQQPKRKHDKGVSYSDVTQGLTYAHIDHDT